MSDGLDDGPDARWLVEACRRVGASAGTVHRRRDGALHLTAAWHIPPPVIARTRTIPRGKGMAGLAWQRAAPVTTCDLKSDPTDDIQPGARAVAARRAAALPVFDGIGEPIAVVGFAFRDRGELDRGTLADLAREADALPRAS